MKYNKIKSNQIKYKNRCYKIKGGFMEATKEALIVVKNKEENKEIKQNKNNFLKQAIKITWIFVIGSVLGYIVEMIVGLVQNGHFVNRQGLVIGPFIQVYGIGLVIYYLLIPHAKTNTSVFFISMILGGIIEYLCSYFQERFFGTISWDYSNLLFNINGRTSLLHCIYWGIGGLLFIKFIYPQVQKIDKIYKKRYVKVLSFALIAFMFFDITITTLATQRQLERKKNIPSDNILDVVLDTYYPDEKLKYIYSNAKEI